jgi:desulfoferrodoxin (superoxide reductase-like protein)
VEVMGIFIDCSQIFHTMDATNYVKWITYFVNLLRFTLKLDN